MDDRAQAIRAERQGGRKRKVEGRRRRIDDGVQEKSRKAGRLVGRHQMAEDRSLKS